MTEVYFSLGSNEGDRLSSLVNAVKLIAGNIGIVKGFSSVFQSEPWGFKSETAFYNVVLRVETKLTPQHILTKLIGIENSLGRIRHGKGYTNRIIDIDILFYGTEQFTQKDLKIPHPLMHQRKFVLYPLSEIAPDLYHPVFQVSVSDLLVKLNEPGPLTVMADKEEFARLLNSIK